MLVLQIVGDQVESRSHSQLNSWLQCGQAYRLERILRVPRLPGWWYPAGTACHAAIEWWLRNRLAKGER